MDRRVAEVVLGKCLGCRDGESVLIVADTASEHLGADFHRAAVAIGFDAALCLMPPRRQTQEPSAAVAEAIKRCSAAVLLTSTSLTHTRARREACDLHGVRIASMPGVDPDRLEHLLMIDYEALAARCGELAPLLEGPRRVRITSPSGTDLSFETGGRPVHRDVGDLRARGAFGNLPCGEVCLAPLEGTAQGTVVVDGSVAGLGLCERPVRIRFEKGRAVEIDDARLSALLSGHGELAFNLAEFGIGLNPHAEVVGNVIEDEKAVGTVHVALGNNAALGGVVSVPIHVDAVLLGARVGIDGVALAEKWLGTGRRAERRRTRPAGEVVQSDTYRALFKHSNDAQYVLDAETQQFLEVNPSFEKLTGYERSELLGGSVVATKMVAPESMPTYQQKIEARKKNPAESYELRILCKDGQKKPVEISVHSMVVEGRRVVIGSIHDLSAHKRIEQEMWEKIQELGFASSRIYALTEKIRRVPEFTPRLLSITDEQELLHRATETLCAREGLGYSEVSFYLLKGDALELSYSNTKKTRKRNVKLTEDSRLVRILSGEEPPVIGRHEAVLPLKGRDRNIGVVEVAFHPKEIEVLEGNERALKGYQDLLQTLSAILGLLVENLHLYETVRQQSILDPLTGVYNRRYFDQKLAHEVQRAMRYPRALSLLLIDVDHFKQINDTTSYRQGDLVLVETARMLRDHTREVDSVCRIGGDEFAVIMPETPYEPALQKAEQLRKEVADKVYENVVEPSKPVRISLSIGVTSFTDDVRSPDDMVAVVDETTHTAKRGGRNMVYGALPKPSREGSKPHRTTTRRLAPPK